MAFGERVAWRDKYFVQQLPATLDLSIGVDTQIIKGPQITPIFNPGLITAPLNIGILGTGAGTTGRFKMKLTDHPNIPAVSGVQDVRQTTGTSERNFFEFISTVAEPGSITLNMQMHVYNLSLFLYSLLQSGYTETEINTNTRIFGQGVAYIEPDLEVYLSMMRLLETVGAAENDYSSHIALGALCNTLTISGEQGGIMTMAADCMTAEGIIANRAGYSEAAKRSYIRPIPQSTMVGATLALEYFDWTSGASGAWTAVTNVSLVESSLDFTDLSTIGALTAEVAWDTGLINLGPDSTFGNQGLIDDDKRLPLRHVLFPGDARTATGVGALGGVDNYANQGFEDEQPLLFQDAEIRIGNPKDAAGDNAGMTDLYKIYLPSFSLTMNNNPVPYFYDEPFLVKYLLGDLVGEGTLTLPWGSPIPTAYANQRVSEANKAIEDFRHGKMVKLVIFWRNPWVGSALVVAQDAGTLAKLKLGGMSITMHIRYTDSTFEGDNELGNTLPFQVVSSYDATHPALVAAKDKTAVEFQMVYDITKLDRGAQALT